MKSLLVIFLLIAAVASSTYRPEGRIIRGNDAQDMEYPFQAAIFIHGSPYSPEKFCGGTLISRRYVLTAANCFKHPDTGGLIPDVTMTVSLNVTNVRSAWAQNFTTKTYTIHETFNFDSYDNDIAVIKLDELVTLGNGIEVVRMPRIADANEKFEDRRTITLGWGKPQSGWSGGIPIDNLRYLKESVISNTKCWAFFPAYIKDKHICTSIGIGTPCDGDEGGPLLMQEEDGVLTQIGLFSFQFRLLCDSVHPAVFTRTSKFLNWIESHTDIIPRM